MLLQVPSTGDMGSDSGRGSLEVLFLSHMHVRGGHMCMHVDIALY